VHRLNRLHTGCCLGGRVASQLGRAGPPLSKTAAGHLRFVSCPEHQRCVLQVLHHAAGGARTHDPRIKSPLLYQLSYSGAWGMIAARGGWKTVGCARGGVGVVRRWIDVPQAPRGAARRRRSRRRRCSRPRAQWRKCRRAVNTIAAPALSTASTVRWSRSEPPGWMIAVTPAARPISAASGNGKNASEAMTDPGT
jgi:hypothetical protein